MMTIKQWFFGIFLTLPLNTEIIYFLGQISLFLFIKLMTLMMNLYSDFLYENMLSL